MNERWELNEEFTFEEAILIALELDGCLSSLKELNNLVGRGRCQFIDTYPDDSQIAAFKKLDACELKKLALKAKKMNQNLISLVSSGFFVDHVRLVGTFNHLINRTGLSLWLEKIGREALADIFKPTNEQEQDNLWDYGYIKAPELILLIDAYNHFWKDLQDGETEPKNKDVIDWLEMNARHRQIKTRDGSDDVLGLGKAKKENMATIVKPK